MQHGKREEAQRRRSIGTSLEADREADWMTMNDTKMKIDVIEQPEGSNRST